jgi:hypothetical protein
VPAESAAQPGPLGDQVAAVVRQQLHRPGRAVQARDRQVRLQQRGPRDRQRVDRVGLATLPPARRSPAISRVCTRTTVNPAASRSPSRRRVRCRPTNIIGALSPADHGQRGRSSHVDWPPSFATGTRTGDAAGRKAICSRGASQASRGRAAPCGPFCRSPGPVPSIASLPRTQPVRACPRAWRPPIPSARAIASARARTCNARQPACQNHPICAICTKSDETCPAKQAAPALIEGSLARPSVTRCGG